MIREGERDWSGGEAWRRVCKRNVEEIQACLVFKSHVS